MNIVALVGNLASEPELRQTSGGRAVCSFRLAVSRFGKDETADFFTVVTWERQAEICKEYLAVGRRVAVDGRLHQSTWEVKDGDTTVKRGRIEVVAHRVELLGPRPKRPRDHDGDEPSAAEAPRDAAAAIGDFDEVFGEPAPTSPELLPA